MKYVKLRIKNKDFGKNTYAPEFNEYWCLLLKDSEQVKEYLLHDAEMYSKALFSMRRVEDVKNGKFGNVRLDHLSTHREHALATYISYKASTTEKGKQIWPQEVLNDIKFGKAKSLLSAIHTGTIQISPAGGWCLHDSFVDLWKAEVIDEVEKDGFGFPTDVAPYKANVLILENGSNIDDSLYRYAKKLPGAKDFSGLKTITELKDKDGDWVGKCIAQSKIIVLETQAVDMVQIDKFMKLFTILENKEVHIKTVNQEVIKNHKLFELNDKKHKIVFF